MFHVTLGRWLQIDPIGFESGDAKFYRYIQNSGTNLTDPTGEAPGLQKFDEEKRLAMMVSIFDGMINEYERQLRERLKGKPTGIQNIRGYDLDACLIDNLNGRLATLYRIRDRIKLVQYPMAKKLAAITGDINKQRKDMKVAEAAMATILNSPSEVKNCGILTIDLSRIANSMLCEVEGKLAGLDDANKAIDIGLLPAR